MLNQIEVRNAAGTLLTFVLDDVADGYVLQDVQGLDPVKATIISSEFANLDGVQYQTSKREARNLLVYLGLEPDYVSTSVRGLRQNLYKWFMPKSPVNIRLFDTEGPTVSIDGRIESCESPLFVKDPQAVISVFCPDSDFVELTSESGSGNTVSDTTEFLITYDGTVETGIEFTLNLNRTESDFIIYHRQPDNQIKTLEFNASLLNLDTLVINTNVGQKSITLTRSGVESSLLYGREPKSDWFELQPGDNYFRWYATGAAIPFTYEYTNRYGGL